jgi:hypothetical protein
MLERPAATGRQVAAARIVADHLPREIPVSRSLLILVVTILVVAASYYGFSRYAANSQAPANAAAAMLPQAADTTKGNAQVAAPSAPPATGADAAAPSTPAIAAAAPAALAPAAPAPGTFSIVIDKARPPAPSDVIRVNKDDQVTLSITSDRAGHLEVHGYRKEVKVEPGTTATMSFAAVRTGRFPIDLHASDGAHVEVTALEVMPR